MRGTLIVAGLISASISAPALAQAVTDPVGDFIPTFVGNRDADLDITSFMAAFDANNAQFLLQGTVAGTIDPSTLGLYVIGVNTGAGARNPFADIAPNVRFDKVVLVRQDGTGLVDTIPATILNSNITISGNAFSVLVPLSTLNSTGASPSDFTFNVWSRNGLGNINQIADFAPNNSMVRAAVPEPSTWGLMVIGFGILGGAMRGRSKVRRKTIFAF